LGTTGELFDAAVGSLIAKRTVQTFLDNLKDAVLALRRLGFDAAGVKGT
jgi:hypothetical protein